MAAILPSPNSLLTRKEALQQELVELMKYHTELSTDLPRQFLQVRSSPHTVTKVSVYNLWTALSLAPREALYLHSAIKRCTSSSHKSSLKAHESTNLRLRSVASAQERFVNLLQHSVMRRRS